MGNFNIEQILFFPVKESESRKNFPIGIQIYFAGFIIRILPLIFPAITLYSALVMYTGFTQAYRDGKTKIS